MCYSKTWSTSMPNFIPICSVVFAWKRNKHTYIPTNIRIYNISRIVCIIEFIKFHLLLNSRRTNSRKNLIHFQGTTRSIYTWIINFNYFYVRIRLTFPSCEGGELQTPPSNTRWVFRLLDRLLNYKVRPP